MRYFYYQGLLASGEKKTGFIKLAFNNEISAQYYLEQRLNVVILKLIMIFAYLNPLFDLLAMLRTTPISREELADFLRNISLMQRSGIPIFDAIKELAGADSTPQIRKLSQDLLEELHSGMPLSECFQRHSDIIPDTVLHLTQIGESSGTLDRTLMDASRHLSRIGKIIQDSKRAMIYPAFVFLSILGAAAFWVGYVIPSISGLFKQMQVELPPLTQWMITFSENFSSNISLFIVTFVIVIAAIILTIKKNQAIRYKFHALLLFLPISKNLTQSASLAFITEYLSLLVASGLTIFESLKILEHSINNEVYKKTIYQMQQGIIRGNTLSSEMRASKYYPGFVIRMISVGEESGNLDEQLSYLAEEYQQRFDNLVASIAEIIKPVVMLFAGSLFILMIVALFLPIYQLIGQVGVY
ncbi:MAG: type II secretion system F family protein [Pseudomonadota bacterium]